MGMCTRQEVKSKERSFYNRLAEKVIKYKNWREIYPLYLQAPYEAYLQNFPKKIGENCKVLELCCGMGEFSFDIAEITGGDVLAIDISDKSIEICKQQARQSQNDRLTFLVADVEELDLAGKSFDIICMSGSLSYLDLAVLFEKVKRWLKPEGSFICVDTYGHSPLFNVKRRFNYLLKQDTKQTLCGIPKVGTIETISHCFKEAKIEFFGIFAFIGPFLQPLFGAQRTANFVNFLDKKFSFLQKYAFKFVFVGRSLKG